MACHKILGTARTPSVLLYHVQSIHIVLAPEGEGMKRRCCCLSCGVLECSYPLFFVTLELFFTTTILVE